MDSEGAMIAGTGAAPPAVKHPLPEVPPNPKLMEEDSSAAELVQLSDLMSSFQWSGDELDTCARVILNPASTEAELLKAVMQLKQLLSTSRENVYSIAQDVIDSGALQGLVHLVSSASPYDSLRQPAAFCLTNVAAGSDEQTGYVVSAGAVPVFIEALRSKNEQLRRQAIFCLANIAGGTSQFRQMLAEYPDYFHGIRYSFVNSTDRRVEDLACWNVRNMIILGGPRLDQLTAGIDFFAELLCRNVPPTTDICVRLTDGWASWQIALDGPNALINPEINSSLLRFTTEAFATLSKTQAGRDLIVSRGLPTVLLYHAKFSSQHSIRNHSLEAIANICLLGPTVAGRALARNGAIIGLSELIADAMTYSPHQRVLAAKALIALCGLAPQDIIDGTAQMNVMTVEAAQRYWEGQNDQSDGFDDPSEHTRPSAQLQSTINIAYAIFTQQDRIEDFTLREKCGRIIVACLNQISQPYLVEMLNPTSIGLVLQILDLAADIDSRDTTSIWLSGSVNPDNQENMLASALTALTPGEPALGKAAFVLGGLQLIDRLLTLGNVFVESQGAVENPVAALIRQTGDGPAIFSSITMRPNLPFQVVQKTMNIVNTYFQ